VGKEFLDTNDGAGNTFKPRPKPVLIGTAVVGGDHDVFSIDRGPDPSILEEGLVRTCPCSTRPFPGPHHRRRGDLLVHGFDPGRVHRLRTARVEFNHGQLRLEGSPKASVETAEVVNHLHPVRAEGQCSTLPGHLLLLATLGGRVLTSRSSSSGTWAPSPSVSPRPSFFMPLGRSWDQRKKVVETDPTTNSAAARAATFTPRLRRGRHRRRPFNDKQFGGHEPGHQFTTLFVACWRLTASA